MRLSADDRAAVARAVAAAEAATSGEIVVVVAPQSDSYRDAALHWIVLAMLGVVGVLAAVPGNGLGLLAPVTDPWGPGWSSGALLSALMLLLATVALAGLLAMRSLSVRTALAPGHTKARRVRARALLLFHAAVEARTRGRTGVLIYLSLAERRAEIVADAAVHARVAPDAWGHAMHALLAAVRERRAGDGLAAAVTEVGKILAAHAPRRADDVNELPDEVVEL